MKFSFIEVILILLIIVLSFVAYNQKQKLDSVYETLDIQHEAILKQKLLIDLQTTQIDSMGYGKRQPIFPQFL
jgi:hypothetical protein